MLLVGTKEWKRADGRLPGARCRRHAAAGGKPAEWRLCCTVSVRRATRL